MDLRQLRERVSLRQEDVAACLDVDQAAVSNWERGKNRPLRKYWKRMCRLYNISEEELAAGIQLSAIAQ